MGSSFSMPSVTHLRMNPGMAAPAQGHEIGNIICTALRQWQLVMYLLCCHIPSFCKTLLTQRMRLCIGGTDEPPGSAVSFLMNWIAFVLVVVLICQLLMFFTVSSLSKSWAAWIRTRSLRSSWQIITSIWA